VAPALRIVGAVALSALAFALYARVEWPWFALGWCGLVPWLAALDRRATLGGALAAGVLMSEAFTLAVFAWFIGAVAGYADAPWPVGLAVVIATAPLIQPQFIACAAARWLARRRGAGPWRIALTGACAYVGAEWALPKLFADTLGHGFLATARLRQAADLVGAHGLTFLLVLANEAVLLSWRSRREPALRRPARRGAVVGLATLVVLTLYGELRLRQFAAGGEAPLSVGIVQADISHYDRLAREIGTYDAVRLILDAHTTLSEALLASNPRPDLLIWPETVYPTTFGAPKSDDGAAFDAELRAAVARAGVPLIFGAYDVGDGREYNAAFVLAPRADGAATVGVYRKAQLFPFTERVPAWLDGAALRAWLPWLGTWQPGSGQRVLDVPLRDGRTLRVAPLICYDAVNPSLALAAVRDGAQLLVALSNDSWFADGNGPRLHLVVAAFRSIETRRPQVRATNTGISAVISPTGELLDTLGVHQRGTLAARVTPLRGAATLLLAWGDWFPPTALAAAFLLLAAPRRRSQLQRL
jgi:apolipoprotein N-acyltransferase